MDSSAELEKAIDKIQKLLAMANDTSSPNEALLAANRARKLMDKYQLSQEDIESKIGSQFLETGISSNKTRIFLWEKYLASAAGSMNDCRSVIRRGRNQVSFLFQGFKPDAIVAKMTMDYLTKAAQRTKKELGVKGLSESNLFMQGFSGEVLNRANEIKREREKQFVSNTGTELVLLKMTEIQKHFGELNSCRNHKPRAPLSRSEREAYSQGLQAGESISLDKQVYGQESAKLSI